MKIKKKVLFEKMINQKKWNSIYDVYFNKLEKPYVRKWYDKYKISNNAYFINNIKTDDYNSFLNNIKILFLNDINEKRFHLAFTRLQKKLPILSEYILYHCFEQKTFSKIVFSKIFKTIYIYLKKDRTLFSNEISNESLIEMFMYSNLETQMSENELKFINSVKFPLKIYRGVAGKTLMQASNGISWTTSIKKAEEFAQFNQKEYNSNSTIIIEGSIQKENIIVYINDSGRNENEIIVNPKKIIDIKTFANKTYT